MKKKSEFSIWVK